MRRGELVLRGPRGLGARWGDAVVEAGDGEFGFDLGEGDEVVEGFVDLNSEASVGAAAVEGDVGKVGLEEQDDFQRRDREVGFELFAEVDSAGRGGEHFGNQGWVVKKVRTSINLDAGNRAVRIVEPSLPRKLNADLKIAAEGVAGFAKKLIT